VLIAIVEDRRTIETIGQFPRQSIYRHGRLRASQVNFMLASILSLWESGDPKYIFSNIHIGYL